jgi:hypothetical protein
MPAYQNTTVNSRKLILGNAKIETAATAGGTFVNLGAGIVTSFTHTPELYAVQAGNAPDPIEGVATETANIEFEMIEYDASVLAAITGGLIKSTSSTHLSTINAGGNQEITPRAFKVTNTWTSGTTTVETVLTVYKATLSTGPSINFKSDNDADPVGIMPGTILAKLDTSRSAGSQLYTITRTLIP